MAKGRYQKQSNGGAIVKAVGAVLVAGVLAAGVCCMGYASRNAEGQWFGNSDLKSWHWSDKSPVTDEGEKPNGGGNTDNKPVEDYTGSVIGEGENNGISLLSAVLPREAYAANGVSEQADSAYTLTAEITPDYADDKSVDWSVAWANIASEWASGKTVTDYVTVTPTEDGALTAVLACNQDFGEPIIVTVTSRSNPEVSAVCFVEYYQRVKSVNYKFYYDGEEVTPGIENSVYKFDYTGAESDYSVEAVPVYSNYTIEDTYNTSVNGALTSSFGYTATDSLNTLKIAAGMRGGEGKGYSNFYSASLSYINAYRTNLQGHGAQVVVNNFNSAKTVAQTSTHPRDVYAYAAYTAWQSDNDFDKWETTLNAYVPLPYNYYGASIATYNDFVTAVNRCNSEGEGVIEYTIKIRGAHSSYETVLKLGYGELKVNVSNVNISDTSIAF